MSYQPTVSIIIAVKNAKEYLKQTLASIAKQNYSKLEVVIIDGASTDGTVEVIREYQSIVTHWVSEKDEGISDAFNKGLKKSSGEYINFQGAGDTLYYENCISDLFHDLNSSVILACGKILRVQEDGKTPLWTAPKHTRFRVCSLLFKMPLPHQALFTHRSFFEEMGLFDKQVKFAMDYELLLRAYKKFPKTVVKNVFISKWRAGGVGQNRIHEIFDEYHRIKLQHEVASTFVLKFIDKLNRFKYKLKQTFYVL